MLSIMEPALMILVKRSEESTRREKQARRGSKEATQ
jgi:hypothetical protein